MKKRLLACILAISMFVMLLPLEAFAGSVVVQAYIGSQGTTSVLVGRGDTITLTASVAGYGGQMSLQWYKASSANLSDPNVTVAAIDGAVGTTYEAPIDTVGTYYYYCSGNNGDYKSGVLTVAVYNPVVAYVVNASADPVSGGTVSGGTVSGGTVSGGGTYGQNSPCTLTATPSAGFVFAGWKENGAVVSTNAQYTFTVTGSRTLSASFTRNTAVNEIITVGNIRYKITSLYPAEVSVIGNSLTGNTAVTLPQTLAYKGINYSVTRIGDNAFDGCTSLTSITIPSSVTGIGEEAFYRCTSLTSITMPGGVTRIGDNAFDSCTSLKSVTIPSSVTSIGYGTFNGCTSLTSITIPSSVTSIGEGAFDNCKSLTSIAIPSSVTSIGDNAFYLCTSLTSITIPSSVTSIGNYTFALCAALKSITIPSSVTSIGDHAFYYCTALSSITIPSSVTDIKDDAFSNCTSLRYITFPSSVTSIGKKLFDSIPIYAVFFGDAPARPAKWDSFWKNSYYYTPGGAAVIPAQTTASAVGSVIISSPGNNLGNISTVLTPVSGATTASLLAAANAGLPGGVYGVVAGVGVTLDGNTETLLVGRPTTLGFQITGDTGTFDMTGAKVVHQYGSSVEILPTSWNADSRVITVVTANGASPFVIVAPLKTAEHTVANPHTGDDSVIPFWIPLVVLALGAMVFLLSFARKRKKQC